MEILENGRVLLERSKTIPEFIDTLISDIDDTIDDYRDTLRKKDNDRAYIAIISELKRWRKSLKELKAEYEEVDNE